MTHPFERLLLATEHSEFDSGAEAVAFALAKRCGLPLAGVLPILGNAEYEMVAPEHAARADALAAERRSALEAAARAYGVAFDLRVRHGPELDAEIVAEARDRAADLIVIRRRGKRGFLANLLVGEMVGKVVAQAPCSVLVTPRGAAMWQRRVMLAVDPQAQDRGSVTHAAAIAAACGLPLQLTCVAAEAAARVGAEQALAQALAHARGVHAASDGDVRVGRAPDVLIAAARGVHAASDGDVRVGRAPDVLIAAAREAGADLLVIARRAGAAQKVIGRAECPVLIHVDPSMQGVT